MQKIPLFITTTLLVWIQQVLSLGLPRVWMRPQLPVLLAVLLGMRGTPMGWYMYAAWLGLLTDLTSHGEIGAYGMSFLLSSIGLHYLQRLLYEVTLLNQLMMIATFSSLGLGLGLIFAHWNISQGRWGYWLISGIFPSACWNAALVGLSTYLLQYWKMHSLTRTSRFGSSFLDPPRQN